MKKLITPFAVVMLVLALTINSYAEDKLSPYLKVGELTVSMDEAVKQVKDALTSKGFDIIGEYHPETKAGLYVIAYTRDDLQKISLKVKDRGALASVLKIGFVEKDGKIIVSMLNPPYLFYAYLMDETDKHIGELTAVSNHAKEALKVVGSDFTPFGGGVELDDLKDYHYMMMMPYFTDPVELNEFDSFDEGLSVIRKNLEAKKGNTLKVYELVFPNKEVAIFGIALLDPEEGEGHFLPIIGEDHIAAMPYEIIFQGKEATMLHGKYRFALLWPELTMGQFMKISSTPGDVEDVMEELTED